MFYKQTPVKITGNPLAAGCQVFYRKIYGFFTVCVLTKVIIRLFASDNFTIRLHTQWPSCHKWCKCWLYGHKSPSLFYIISVLIKKYSTGCANIKLPRKNIWEKNIWENNFCQVREKSLNLRLVPRKGLEKNGKFRVNLIATAVFRKIYILFKGEKMYYLES